MIYGYVRVSTDQQDENNQKVGVDNKALSMGIKIDEYIIDHGVSGTKEPEERELGRLMNKLKKDDLIIASELSRLGRSLFMIMSILNKLMAIDAKVWTIKDNYRLGDDIQSKVLAFAFGIAAEIERDLISQRTKEALLLKRKEGVVLGRPAGRKSSHVKLSGKEKEIKKLRKRNVSKSEIGRMFSVNRMTVDAFMKNNGII